MTAHLGLYRTVQPTSCWWIFTYPLVSCSDYRSKPIVSTVERPFRRHHRLLKSIACQPFGTRIDAEPGLRIKVNE